LFTYKKAFSSARVSIIGALCNNKLLEVVMQEGFTCRESIEAFLESLFTITGPDFTLIMDNASFHKGGNIQQIAKKHNCNIVYLSPYSPDLNPIEKFWFPIKNQIRKHLYNYSNNIFNASFHAFRELRHLLHDNLLSRSIL